MKQTQTYRSTASLLILTMLLITIIIESYPLKAVAQELNIYNNRASMAAVKNIHAPSASNYKKRFWRATAEWTMVQLLPWASNCYIRKAGFAKISFKSIAHNLKPGSLEWDDNKFFNNQFSHPFQGNLYFNSFRSNGYDFWQSAPATFAGSYIWETICETHQPAPNDFLNTGLGGIVLGEMSNRLSKIILRSKAGKTKIIMREPVTILVNSTGGLNSSMDNKREKNEPANFDGPSLSVVTDAGLRYINKKGKFLFSKPKRQIFGRTCLQYGDPYTQFKEPFSNFSLVTEIGNDDSASANILQIEGCIYGKKIKQTGKSDHVFSISMNYDFYNISALVFGAQSFRANLLSRFNFSKQVQLQVKAGAGMITLAALPDKYLYYGEGRNYDYCTGISFQLGAGINIANKLFYDFKCNGGKAITLNGYRSSHFFYNTLSTMRMVIYKGLSISATTSHYIFNGYYKDFSSVSDHHLFRYFGLGYKITI